VNTSSFLGVRDMRRVIYRLDEGKPFDVRWTPSTTGNRVFSPSGVAFIKSLPDKGKLFFRVFGFDGAPTDATFELVSVAELRNKIASACRWSEGLTAQPHSSATLTAVHASNRHVRSEARHTPAASSTGNRGRRQDGRSVGSLCRFSRFQ
jgi:hypothetical protein